MTAATVHFSAADLATLDEHLLARSAAVVPMREIAVGNDRPDVIGLRHDVDANRDSLETAVKLAGWEAERGYRSSYYLLHSAGYWRSEGFADAVAEIAGLGHEIGIHTNAIAEALRLGVDPDALLEEALGRLRALGHDVTGVVAHGDELCGRLAFVNDEHFLECARPGYGAADRVISYRGYDLRLRPVPLDRFALAYLPNWLPRSVYLSDTGAAWNLDVQTVGAGFPYAHQVHVLQHPDWWGEAL